MVSINTIRSRNIFFSKKVLIPIIIFIFIVIAVLFIFVFNSSKDSGPTNVAIDKETLENINSLDFNVSQPKVVPKDYARIYVDIISENASATQCLEVVQIYSASTPSFDTRTNPEELPNLLDGLDSITEIDLYNYPLECGIERPDDSEVFNIGDHPGWISDSDPTKTTLLELAVNQALIRVETTLNRQEIAQVLQEFVSFSDIAPQDSLEL